jgi:hypothetical protein
MKIYTINYSPEGHRSVDASGTPAGYRWNATTPPMKDQAAAERWADARERLGQEPKAEPKAELVNPLDDPRMDGTAWIPARYVTQAMLDAWPVWESRVSGMPDLWLDAAHDLPPGFGHPYQRRPLRLSGMNEQGEIRACDMTPAHFDRVSSWQWKSDAREEPWQATNPGENHVEYCDTSDSPPEMWRPTAFARLDKAELEAQELSELYDLLGVDSLQAATEAVKTRILDLEADCRLLCRAIAPGSFRGGVEDHVLRAQELRASLSGLAGRHILQGHEDHKTAHKLARGD